MKKENPVAEDMFEKAREVFFGITETSPKSSASSDEFLKPRNEGFGQMCVEEEQANPKAAQ
jgi:hypothetical protein